MCVKDRIDHEEEDSCASSRIIYLKENYFNSYLALPEYCSLFHILNMLAVNLIFKSSAHSSCLHLSGSHIKYIHIDLAAWFELSV